MTVPRPRKNGTAPKPASSGLRVTADLALGGGAGDWLSASHMVLLREIDATGSITRAAKAAGVSYKTAWDTLNLLNNLSERPLVESAAGGRHGGGTRLTPHGRRLLQVYQVMAEEHRKYLDRLGRAAGDFERFYSLTRRIAMKISARNQLLGTIARIHKGQVAAEIEIRLKGKDALVAEITKEGAEGLRLKEGDEAYALFKATSVLLAKGGDLRLSARNRLRGRVERIALGEINADVVIKLPGGNTVASIVTREALDGLGLAEGDEATAVFKATSVIIGLP